MFSFEIKQKVELFSEIKFHIIIKQHIWAVKRKNTKFLIPTFSENMKIIMTTFIVITYININIA